MLMAMWRGASSVPATKSSSPGPVRPERLTCWRSDFQQRLDLRPGTAPPTGAVASNAPAETAIPMATRR